MAHIFTKKTYISLILCILFIAISFFGNIRIFAQSSNSEIPVPRINVPPTLLSSGSREVTIEGFRLSSQEKIILCHNKDFCNEPIGTLVAEDPTRGWTETIELVDGKNLISVVAQNGEEFSEVKHFLLFFSENVIDVSQVVPDDLQQCLEEKAGDILAFTNTGNINPLFISQLNTIFAAQPNRFRSPISFQFFSGGDRSQIGQFFSSKELFLTNFESRRNPLLDFEGSDNISEELLESNAISPDSAAAVSGGVNNVNDLAAISEIVSQLLTSDQGILCLHSFEADLGENFFDPDANSFGNIPGSFDENGNFIPDNPDGAEGIDLDGDGEFDIVFSDIGLTDEECVEESIGECVKKECSVDADCGEGEGCVDEICVVGACDFLCEFFKTNDCLIDTDCEEGLICQNNKCEIDNGENLSNFTQSPVFFAGGQSGCPTYYAQYDGTSVRLPSALDAITNAWAEKESLTKFHFSVDPLLLDSNMIITMEEKEDELFFLNNVGLLGMIHDKDFVFEFDRFGNMISLLQSKSIEPQETYSVFYPWRGHQYLARTQGFYDEAKESFEHQKSLFDVFAYATAYLVSTISHKDVVELDVNACSDLRSSGNECFVVVEPQTTDARENKKFDMVNNYISREDVDRYYEIVTTNKSAGDLMTDFTEEHMNIEVEFWDEQRGKWELQEGNINMHNMKTAVLVPEDISRIRFVYKKGNFTFNNFVLVEGESFSSPEYIEANLLAVSSDAKDINKETLFSDVLNFDEQRVLFEEGESVSFDFDITPILEKQKSAGGKKQITLFLKTGGYYEVFRKK